MDKLYAIYKDDKMVIKKGYISKTGAKSALTNLAKKDVNNKTKWAINKVKEINNEKKQKILEAKKEKYKIEKFIPERELTFKNWLKNIFMKGGE